MLLLRGLQQLRRSVGPAYFATPGTGSSRSAAREAQRAGARRVQALIRTAICLRPRQTRRRAGLGPGGRASRPFRCRGPGTETLFAELAELAMLGRALQDRGAQSACCIRLTLLLTPRFPIPLRQTPLAAHAGAAVPEAATLRRSRPPRRRCCAASSPAPPGLSYPHSQPRSRWKGCPGLPRRSRSRREFTACPGRWRRCSAWDGAGSRWPRCWRRRWSWRSWWPCRARSGSRCITARCPRDRQRPPTSGRLRRRAR